MAKVTCKIEPPDYIKCKTYERYKKELLAWQAVTDLKKQKQGIAVALSLPQNADTWSIRDRVFDEMDLDDLSKYDGLDRLIEFLDKHLAKDDLVTTLEKFEEFEEYSRKRGQSIVDYIAEFDQKYNRIAKLKMELPAPILAFKLLKRADITKEERLLVLTGMDYNDKEELYEQAKDSLKKFKGQTGSGSSLSGSAIKLEAVNVAQEELYVGAGPGGYSSGENVNVAQEEVYVGAGAGGYSRGGKFRGRGWRGNSWRGGNSYNSGYGQPMTGNSGAGASNWRGNSGTAFRGNSSRGSAMMPGNGRNGNGGQRPVNPNGKDGRTMLCLACGSFRHLVSACPWSWENTDAQVNVMGEENFVQDRYYEVEEAVLLTGLNRNSISQMSKEARNCAVLDSACTSTVCGKEWLDCYVKSLSQSDRADVSQEEGTKWFRFGGGEKLKSQGRFILPIVLAGKEVRLSTDVVESDIPLLLSKSAMKAAKVKLDLENDTAEIYGKPVSLNHTTSGHYSVPIDRTQEVSVESVCAVKLDELDEKSRYDILLKLHRQFCHPSEKKLAALLKDANCWQDDYKSVLAEIYGKCDICKMYKKTPDRPVVCLPMATRFNQKVCMDLKKWQDKWILHMIDMFSRFTVSVFISRKRPSDVIDKVMTCWVGAGFGVMEGILTDNGGEFNAEEIRDVASILNVEDHTTAAYSPFQNGLCERNHAVVDHMLTKLSEQCPNTNSEVLLAWANNAKNSLQMWHGYSSYQIVFGKNPNLPNVLTEQLPALEGITSSETLAKHLNALHEARQAFIRSEADERIRRALRSKVRASEQVFNPGDRVFYKRDGHVRWLGPAKVIFQDGRVVFVRHGGVFVRVSPNRLLKTGHDFSSQDDEVDQAGEGELSENNGHSAAETVTDRNLAADTKVGDCNNNSENSDTPDRPGNTDEYEARSHDAGDCNDDDRYELLKKGKKIQYKRGEEWVDATVSGRAGKATGQFKFWYNITEDDSGIVKSLNLEDCSMWRKNEEEVNLVLIPKRKHNDPACIVAKEAELQKLQDFQTYEITNDIGQDRISTTWVMYWKGKDVRARLVARGFEEEGGFRKDSPTVAKSTLRLLLAIASSKGWELKSTDIKSAFLQGRVLDREVYLTPPREAAIEPGKIWRLKHCLYGLNDAAREFYFSVVEAMQALGCERSRLDPSLYYYKEDDALVGFMASHIDDFIHAGEPSFDRNVMSKLTSKFLAGRLEKGCFGYVGFSIVQSRGGILMDQSDYLEGLENVVIPPEKALQKARDLTTAEQTQLRQIVGRLNWIAQGCRPDIAFEAVDLSTKFQSGVVDDLVRAAKTVNRLKAEKACVFFPSMRDMSSWTLLVYSDAAHANLNNGLSSMGAHVNFLIDSQQQACPLSWHAGKLKRVVRSTLAAETLSLLEGIEDALYLKGILEAMLGRVLVDIPIRAIVDNKSLVEAVHSTKLVDDKRLRIDIGSIKECLDRNLLVSLTWCPGDAQIANCLTKRGASGMKLLTVLQSGKLDVPNF